MRDTERLIDAILTAWGRMSHNQATIRRMTGCGPGPLAGTGIRAGASSALGRMITDLTTHPTAPPDMPLLSDDDLAEVDHIINAMSARLREVVQIEYRGRGRQALKAHRIGITLVNYRVSLKRGRQAVADALGLSM